MTRCLLLLIATLSLISGAFAAEKGVDAFLPAACAPGWAMDGKVATYTPENLYKYIDGEAELYMPYGFRKAATAMYAKPGNKDIGIVANIFEMGSLLDAFGIYANFRSPTLEQMKVGAEGFLDESQLMFYQDRYFVQIEASGAITQEGPLFQSCAEAISRNLPDSKEKPGQLEILIKIPGAVPLTERYYAGGLLGHGFFGRGFTVEVMVGETRAKAILILGGSEEAAARVFTDYGKYLRGSKAAPQISNDRGTVLHVIDPLYKGVVLHRSGQYVVGVVSLKEPRDGDGVVAQLVKRLPGQQ